MLVLKDLDGVLAELASLEKRTVQLDGRFTLHQVLTHCAQSIECSLDGYPQHKPALFKATIGRLALRRFLGQGRMAHDLGAGIPGMADPGDGDGFARLRSAIERFRAFNGPLQPHFAYGPVTRAQYEQVHAMHVANHLSAVKPA